MHVLLVLLSCVSVCLCCHLFVFLLDLSMFVSDCFWCDCFPCVVVLLLLVCFVGVCC